MIAYESNFETNNNRAEAMTDGVLENLHQRKRTDRDLDRHIGAKLRQARTMQGMSQSTLGKKIGLTFQQVQKYEKGINRIGAGLLFKLVIYLNVPLSFFFDGISMDGSRVEAAQSNYSFAPTREVLELIRHYTAIQDPAVRRRIFNLVKAV